MNTQFSKKIMRMQVSRTKLDRRRERKQSACRWHVQLKATIKGRTETLLKTFGTSASQFSREIWLDKITWKIYMRKNDWNCE